MRILGEGHRDTLRAMVNLAFSYEFLGQQEEALELMQKAVEGSRKHLGDDHPDTLTYVRGFNRMFGMSAPPLQNLSDVRQRSKATICNDSFWFRIFILLSRFMYIDLWFGSTVGKERKTVSSKVKRCAKDCRVLEFYFRIYIGSKESIHIFNDCDDVKPQDGVATSRIDEIRRFVAEDRRPIRSSFKTSSIGTPSPSSRQCSSASHANPSITSSPAEVSASPQPTPSSLPPPPVPASPSSNSIVPKPSTRSPVPLWRNLIPIYSPLTKTQRLVPFFLLVGKRCLLVPNPLCIC